MKRMIDNKSIDYLNSLKDGTAQFNKISVVNNDSNEDGIDFTNAIGESSYLHIGADEAGFYFERYENNNDIGHVIIEPTRGVYATGLTDQNTKSLFGNQSIYGEGNIDLYVHYLNIVAGGVQFYGVVYSSNNANVNSIQKLTTLLKATSKQYFISLTSPSAVQGGVLYWDGSIWQVSSVDGFLNVTSVSDVVTTI